uniref:2-hydroxyacid dehydrogenase n=1 Tax=Steinernema glaseri TaxID=37863 RepID=A0A1I8AX14_9BILA
MTRPIVLQLVSLAQHPSFDEIDRHFERIEFQNLNQLSAEQIERVQVLLTSAVTATPSSLMDRLPALKAICSVGVGYDSIDVQAAKQRGIQVSTTPDVLNDCVADMAWALMLDAARRVTESDRYTIARRASGFDMDLRYHNRRPRHDVPWHYEPSLIELAHWADIMVIAAVGGDETRGLINIDVLNALGSKGILVNIARGSQRFKLSQARIDHYTAHAVNQSRHHIGRISQMTTHRPCRTKLGHYTGQAFCPVTGTKALILPGHTMDYKLLHWLCHNN